MFLVESLCILCVVECAFLNVIYIIFNLQTPKKYKS